MPFPEKKLIVGCGNIPFYGTVAHLQGSVGRTPFGDFSASGKSGAITVSSVGSERERLV